MPDRIVHIPPELHDRLKEHCDVHDVFLRDFVSLAIEVALEAEAKAKKRLEVLSNKRPRPEPWSLPPFWLNGGSAT